MNRLAFALLVVGCATVTSSAFAQTADDRRWVAQCERDNADAKASPEVVRRYCICMNDKMDDNETRSISVWERANPRAREECSRQAGWN